MRFSVKFFNWLIISYCSVILFLSVITINGSNTLNKSKILGFRSDYLLHILLFIPLMMLFKWRWEGIKSNVVFWFALGGGIVFAVISEAIQIIVPGRTFNLIDMAANSLGVVVGALISGWGWKAQSAGQ
jgi:VanZ family protein